MTVQTKESQQAMTPKKALETLIEGNKRFATGTNKQKDYLKQVKKTSSSQYPFAVILSCMDSRTSVELIFDQGIGDVFSVRIAGNISNIDILGSLEYACGIAGSKLILVMGHTNCGAVTGACNNYKNGNITGILEKIKPAIEKAAPAEEDSKDNVNAEFVDKVSEINVENTIEEIRKNSKLIRNMEEEGSIAIAGAMYNLETGYVNF